MALTKRLFLLTAAAALIFCFAVLHADAKERNSLTVVRVTNKVIKRGVKRFGINVGARTQWGASQIDKNLFLNPGFEGRHFGSVLIADAGCTAEKFIVDSWDTSKNDDSRGVGLTSRGYLEVPSDQKLSLRRSTRLVLLRMDQKHLSTLTSRLFPPSICVCPASHLNRGRE